MIPLAKTAEPLVLVNNGVAWTKVLTDKLSIGEKPTDAEKSKYRHPDIKSALVLETSNKCAYCESKLQHIHHGDVEHIFPKSLELSKILLWDNLTLACEVCNQNKSNLDPNANLIIDPYTTNPRNHLIFQGSFVFALGTATGQSTVAILDLGRPALIEERGERLKYLMGIFENVLRTDLPLAARRAIYKNLVQREATPDKAFSAMAEDVITAMIAHVPKAVRNGIR
ncbi:HNH endonuclease [Sphingomonas sp. PP-CC-1A-547]|uniref:HNH endonuclease n=1 Tax=Sphingomonas sp. PP-CC-1A-547 TaxID=2135654 RepID=UPI000E750D15|nr:HNH endonuclease signature motif containing protein [Sphingomonas sp. PP-CC-1A-547]RKE47373.1 HNH endonuclease [Sphingomonas sp. PP-CC-1A-547]